MYYRVAIQSGQSATWQWKSTSLSSLQALFQWLQFYRALPRSNEMIPGPSHLESVQEQTLAQRPGNQESLMRFLVRTSGRLLMVLRMSLKPVGYRILRHLTPGPVSSLGSPHH